MTSSENSNPAPRRNARQTVFVAAALLLAAVLVVLMLPGRVSQNAPQIPAVDSSMDAHAEIATLERMFAELPTHAPIALQLGNLYAQQGQHAKAVTYYQHFLEHDTSATGWEVRLDLCKSLFALGRVAEAWAEVEKMLARDSTHPGALYNLGAIEANGGNVSKARIFWNTVVRMHPNDPSAELARAALQKLDATSK